MNKNNSNIIYTCVLQEALKMQKSSILLQIYAGEKDITKLENETTFLAMVAVKAFDEFIKNYSDLNDRKKAKELYTQLFIELELKARKDATTLDGEAKLNGKIKDFELSVQFYIFAILTLATNYQNKNINKIKHILNTYETKVKRVLKNYSDYSLYFKSTYTDFQTMTILLKFLVENS